jgi:enamine deaminase RidA (YjgF/YER057c/UK114 family)
VQSRRRYRGRPGSVQDGVGDRTLLQLSGQVAIDADGKIGGGNDMAAQVRAARFTGTPPTITTVEVSRLWVPGALLEVEVLAIT